MSAIKVLCCTLAVLMLAVGPAHAQDKNVFQLRGHVWQLEVYQEEYFPGAWLTLDKLVHVWESASADGGTVRSVHFTCAPGSCENPSALLGCPYATFVVPDGQGGRVVYHVCNGSRDDQDAGHCLGVTGSARTFPTLLRPADSLTLLMGTLGILASDRCTPKPTHP